MKDRCIFMCTSGDNVICNLYNKILGDIMGYGGHFCINCKSKKKQGDSYTTDEVLRIARMECAKHELCVNCKFNDICTRYDIIPALLELFIISLKEVL